MRKIGVCGVLAAIALMAAAGDANAGNVAINCSVTNTALNTEFTVTNPGGLAGTVYQIKGPCTGGFTIKNDDITIEPLNMMVNNEITSSVGINAARRLTLQNLSIDAGALKPPTVRISGPASVIIAACTIRNSLTDGVQALGPSEVTLVDILGVNSTVTANGRFGVNALGGATVTLTGVGVSGNGVGQVLIGQNSTLAMTPSATSAPDIDAGVSKFGVAADQASSLFLRGSTVKTNSSTFTAIDTSVNSSVVLAGGNTIENTGGGNAVTVTHNSSLFENNGSLFGFTGAADTITGKGLVLVQSSMNLGTGGTTPSSWTGNIVAQNSSFMMSGGMAITGSVALVQAANGFFDKLLGGTNGVSLGVTCPASSGNANSHVANPTNVTPNVVVGATEEKTTPPACLPF